MALLIEILQCDCSLRALLQCLSPRDELRLAKTCSWVRDLLYIWRHWSPLGRLLVPSHASDIFLNFEKENFQISDRYCLKFTDHCGWGVYARKVIPAHEIINFYAGELITTRDSLERYLRYDRQGLNYVLTIREQSPPHRPPITLTTNVDATYLGNVSRFFNHSCDPNLFVVMHRPNLQSPLAIPFFISIRTIAPSEQLTFDYGSSEVDVSTPSMKKRKADPEKPLTECRCGSLNCRRWLPTFT